MEIFIVEEPHDASARGRAVSVEEGESLLAALQRAGVPMQAPCGGAGTCGKCSVDVSRGGGPWMRVLACQTDAEEGMRVRPLAPEGGEFRCAVWELLLDIPYGAVVTYGELAARYEARTGRKTSPRAIGGAVGHNPVSIIIPCHRVVGADGSLTGYAGGVERKRWLLAHEQAAR